MIFDDVAEIMNSDSAMRISERTGLSRNKVKRLSKGIPFILDHNTVFALQKMGYDIEVKRHNKK